MDRIMAQSTQRIQRLEYPAIVELLGAAFLVYAVTIAIYRLYFHPLAKFPGPRIAALTRWYEAFYDVLLDGRYELKIVEFHRKYGPIVRISPFELHIDDSEFFNEIYRQDGRWHKDTFSTNGQAAPGGAVFTADHDVHKHRRAAFNSFLSKPAVAKRMDLIQSKINVLQQRLEEAVQRGGLFELGLAFSAMTIDIATAYISAKSYDSLAAPDFNVKLTEMLQEGGYLWHVNKHIALSRYLLPLMPPALMPASFRPFFAFLKNCEDRTKALIDLHHNGGSGEKETKATGKLTSSSSPPTLVETILSSSSLPAAEKGYKRVNDEVGTVTAAGFETSSNTLRHIAYHVYANPTTILARLRAELDAHPETWTATATATPEEGGEEAHPPFRTWSWDRLSRLPYLTGVIKEGLRLTPGIVTRMQRVSEQPLTYHEKTPGSSRSGGGNGSGARKEEETPQRVWAIPARTPVGMSLMALHRDEAVFPDPTRFRPERWVDDVEGDDDGRRRLERYFAPFSRGTRICAGMHLAWAELYLTVAMLVSQFDFELAGGTGPEDVEWVSDRFILGVKGKNGVRVIARKRPQP
ncbi:hypothetical protein PG990_014468 [Apiospora arundinis]